MTMACDAPPGDWPPVVDPPSAPSAASAWAVASTLEARTPAPAAAAAPAPRTASRAPATRRAADRVAITAARQASAARAGALARGASCCPVRETPCAGSGGGGVKTACAQVCRTPSTTNAAPAAPSRSTSPNCLRIGGYWSLSSRSASKQVRSPVWQAARIWSTLTRRASPSQSRATDLTHCWCPDVSPLTQYSWRLRDQYVHRPVVSVRCRASSSIQPSMSTSPVSYCWAMAATRPLGSRLSRAAMAGSSAESAGLILCSLICRVSGKRAGHGPDTVAGPGELVLDLADRRGAEVEQTGGEHGVGPGFDGRREVGGPAGAAAGDHRHGDLGPDGRDQLQGEPAPGAVGVHGVQQDLAHAELGGPADPLDGVDAGALPAAVGRHLESGGSGGTVPQIGGSRGSPPWASTAHVGGQHDALGPEPERGLGEQLGAGDGRGVQRHLVRAGPQQPVHVVDAAHAAADRERDEDLLGGPADHVVHGVPAVAGRGDVEEHQLVGAVPVVGRGQLDRVPGIAQVTEVDALDHPAVIDVQARDDPDGDGRGGAGHGHRRSPWSSLLVAPLIGSPRPARRGA